MGKKKKKRKKAKAFDSFFKAIRPFISDDRVLRGFLDAASIGISWVAAIRAKKHLEQTQEVAADTAELVEEQKPAKRKPKAA